MDSPSYHVKRCDMTPSVQRIMICLVVLMWVGLSSTLPCAAETSQVNAVTKQVESGARQVGRSVEDTAKVAGEKVQDARRAAQPQAENTFNKVKDGAESAGTSVKNFVNKLFGK